MNRSLIHDVVKIKYTDEGYLPYYPYHLISDSEMIDAFIFNDSNFFDDTYYCDFKEVESEYESLKSYIRDICSRYKSDNNVNIPDWVYSYMIGAVVGPESGQKDVHDLLVLMNMDNLYDEFNASIYKSISDISRKALGYSKTRNVESADGYRPVTVFGEPHIIKYLRLDKVSVRP